MVYLKSVENVITLGKLIGLLFLFCLPLLSILFLKTKRNDLARPVMGTIFLVIFEYMYLLFLTIIYYYFKTCLLLYPFYDLMIFIYNPKEKLSSRKQYK